MFQALTAIGSETARIRGRSAQTGGATGPVRIGGTGIWAARVASALPTRDGSTGEATLFVRYVKPDGRTGHVVLHGTTAITALDDIRRRRLMTSTMG